MLRPFVLLLCLSAPAAASPWKTLVPGVELAEFPSPLKSPVGDSRLTVLRVDVTRRPVRLLSALREGGEPLTAEQWARAHGLLAVTNAGMFHPGGRPVGMVRSGGQVLSTSRPGAYRAFLVLDPVDDTLPKARILDPDCDDVDALLPRYRTVLQSIRMMDCRGKNRWSQQPRAWSTVALGMDEPGRLLVVHARSPYRAYDFIRVVQQLPLGVRRLMYLEGGPEASLHVEAGGRIERRMGSFETGFFESDDNVQYWPLPNVLGVVGRAD